MIQELEDGILNIEDWLQTLKLYNPEKRIEQNMIIAYK